MSDASAGRLAPRPDDRPVLVGDTVTLRPSTLDDRAAIYDWLVRSDATAAMMGPPTFPDAPVPTWEEFLDDYEECFFDGSSAETAGSFVIVAGGEDVGQVNYYVEGGRTSAEMDIWLRSEADTGHGYGPDALRTLVRYVRGAFGIEGFVIRPSARNPRAVAAYERAGFERVDMGRDEEVERFGEPDYADSVVLLLDLG